MVFFNTEKIQAKHKFSGIFVSKFNISLRKANTEIFVINFTFIKKLKTEDEDTGRSKNQRQRVCF